ncbi:hypothetical protein NL676_037272 [Syzygium grande]|nr:hypothetical protein NL676_037272 [Syzygium grande]
MSEKPGQKYERTLEETSTWSVAVVCFILLAISIFIEHVIHRLGKSLCYWGSYPCSLRCFKIPFREYAFREMSQPHGALVARRRRAPKSSSKGRRLLDFSDIGTITRRSLATKGYEKCTEKAS